MKFYFSKNEMESFKNVLESIGAKSTMDVESSSILKTDIEVFLLVCSSHFFTEIRRDLGKVAHVLKENRKRSNFLFGLV